jgi:nitrite reductase (NADH) large subunit
VGGAAGSHVRKGDLLTTVDAPDEVIALTGRFLQYYRENANWLERTYDFVPRLGIERIRSVVVEDGCRRRRDRGCEQPRDVCRHASLRIGCSDRE